jgi:A/G-specific adenine glycosylase
MNLAASCSKALLAWYDIHRRVLPWRAPAGRVADPYHVWLSEIMLQQTTVQAVAGYYRKFLARWPRVEDLAAAPRDEVLAAWAGLGYYARARNLHACAGVVAGTLGGRFPSTAAELRRLPGIGPYTAGAIAAIAFDAREAAMDANAERVVARLTAMDTPFPGGKVRLRALGQGLVPPRRAGDFAQALMDLGSAICTVKRPGCGRCPLAGICEGRAKGIAEALPVKAPKRARPLKRGAAFVAVRADGAVLLQKRPEKGLLAGMLEPPLGPWTENFPTRDEALAAAPFAADWKKRVGVVRHGFTHFELEVEVWVAPLRRAARATSPVNGGGKIWVKPEKLGEVALPTVMKKIIAHGLDAARGTAKTKTPRR